jgi:hypothetical protein
MRWLSDHLFSIGLALLVLGLAAVDSGLGGHQRPFLVFVLIGGIIALWLLTRRPSLVPEGWRARRADGDDTPE